MINCDYKCYFNIVKYFYEDAIGLFQYLGLYQKSGSSNVVALSMPDCLGPLTWS